MPDIQTALKTALEKSPIMPTQIQRIWTYVKDHPGRTSRRIAAEIKIPINSISSLLSQMVNRDMVYSSQEMRLGKSVKVYHVVGRMTQFELLPRKKKGKVKVKAAAAVQAVKPVQPLPIVHFVPAELPKAVAKEPDQVLCSKCQGKSWTKASVDSMTVAEARDLYETLDKLFGRKP